MGPLSIRFCDSAFSMMTVTAASGPISLGNSVQPPQPGTRPRKHSGKASAGTPEEMVRYVHASATSTPPPMAAPLTNAKEGTEQRGQALEGVVAGLGDRQGLLAVLHDLDALEVGADGEDERLAGDADADDLAALGGRLDGVDGLTQLHQAAGAEGVRLGVVEAVVQRDQRELAGVPGQVEELDRRLGDDLVREELCGQSCKVLAHLFSPFQCGFSQMTVPPMPMPTHMDVRP